ncbi:hypothetical protein QJS10_CPB20g01377 [Acorus calamus]|uniref:Uncharacterized protein n=1 Tax=Acorus calamus TaxID=4465 RepID=A0AAV9C8Y7_ACOCL|nr:hypothetical protein QJS10_CPB20g01377 [Acorus calamus]
MRARKLKVLSRYLRKRKRKRKRLKGGMELAMEEKEKQRRTCSVCGKKEKHNKRSCPMLKEMLARNTQ